MRTFVSLLFFLAAFYCHAGGADNQYCTLNGEPLVFWHNNEWQTFQNGRWIPYGAHRKNDRTRQSDLGPTPGSEIAPPNLIIGQPNGQIGQRTIGIGRPSMQMGQRNAQIGRTTIGIGRPNVEMGQNTIAIGQPNSIGQTTIGIGQPTIGIGKPTIGIGQPMSFPRQQGTGNWSRAQ